MRTSDARRWAWPLWMTGTLGLLGGAAFNLAADRVDWSGTTQIVAFLAIGTVGLLVARRRPANPLGWIYLGIWAAVGLAMGLLGGYGTWATTGGVGAPGGTTAVWLTNWIWIPVFVPLVTYAFLLFPDGHLPSPRWRPIAWAIAGTTVLWCVAFALEGHDYTDALGRPAPNPYAIDGLVPFFDAARIVLGFLFTAWLGTCVASLVVRFRRGDRELRQQIKWLMYAGAVVAVWFALPLEHGSGGPADEVQGFVLVLIPLATGIAITKYRLYDIDLVIRKTAVFGVLAAFIGLVYVGIVGGIGLIVGSASDTALSFVAAAAVAIGFQPARERARRLADRLVYGKRATPYEVLAELSERIGEAYGTEDVLPRMAQVLATGTGATGVRVWVRVGMELRAIASAGEVAPTPSVPIHGDEVPPLDGHEAVEVRHQGELLGALSVWMPPADPMTPAKATLVADLAAQAGLVLRNVRLIEELRTSRQRLVAAQDAERRKLERDLHDGAQQQLVGLQVQLRLAEQLVGRDAEGQRAILQRLQGSAGEALEDLRALARGLYPPVLADRGLAAALEGPARRAPVPVVVEAADVGRYPRAVESAVYFCVLEALNNVAKYAEASHADVLIAEREGRLRFEVQDDGRGFDPGDTRYGTGLQGMADRLDAIGGSLRVQSEPGHGTRIVGVVEVDAKVAA